MSPCGGFVLRGRFPPREFLLGGDRGSMASAQPKGRWSPFCAAAERRMPSLPDSKNLKKKESPAKQFGAAHPASGAGPSCPCFGRTARKLKGSVVKCAGRNLRSRISRPRSLIQAAGGGAGEKGDQEIHPYGE